MTLEYSKQYIIMGILYTCIDRPIGPTSPSPLCTVPHANGDAMYYIQTFDEYTGDRVEYSLDNETVDELESLNLAVLVD